MIFDTFCFRDEFDLLECRLTELQDVPDLVHVLVEADRTHGHNTPKPYYYAENKERFAPWQDRIVHVMATDLPDDPNPWTREHAQREWCWEGLYRVGAEPDDIVLHGDVDEIPTAFATKYMRPDGFVRFKQTLYCFAVDWQHPDPWWGTIAGRVKNVTKFTDMRDARCWFLPDVDAGWHFSWLGGPKAADEKMDAFCHLEIEDAWRPRLDDCYQQGIHVDGTKLIPVDVDETWPRWIREGRAPKSWYRP